MVKLDLKDRKILLELDTNSRQSYQEIASKVRLSKDAVFYRIKRLEEAGVIQRYQTIIDVGKLGYISFRIFYKLHDTTSKIEQEIIDFLQRQKIVVWMATIEGYWTINTWILCRKVSELETFWKEFTAKYLNYLADNKLAIFTDITYFSRAYLLEEKQNTSSIKFVSVPKGIQADERDMQILHILNLDARAPILEISKRIKMSPKQISSRIKRLEKDGIIVGYRTMFDLQKLGYLYYKLIIKVKNMAPAREKAFRQYAFDHPNIVYDHTSICGPDFEIDIQVESVEKLRELIQNIKDKFSDIIQEHETWHYLKEHKYIYMPSD